MFIKTNEDAWINLNQCKNVEIQQYSDIDVTNEWQIAFFFIRDPVTAKLNRRIGPFKNKNEALKVLDDIWDAYEDGQPFWEEEPKEELNIKLGNRWYAESSAADTYLRVIERLGLERIKKEKISFGDYLIVVGPVKPDGYRPYAEYSVLDITDRDVIKEILEKIASEFNIDIVVK